MCECGRHQAFEDGALQQTRVNFLGARGIEAVVTIDHTRGNQVSLNWLLYDGHGNLVRLVSPDYTLSAFQWHGVWGEVQSSLGVGRGYCANLGHPEDETGLVYMRARYYEPATGRFISEDPARDGVNWYLYADGNPVNKVDYSGRVSTEEAILIGIIANLITELVKFGARLVYNHVIVPAINRAIALAASLTRAARQRVADWLDRRALALMSHGGLEIEYGSYLAGLAQALPDDWARAWLLLEARDYIRSGIGKVALGITLRHLAAWIRYSE